jgi:nucleoside-diphosphate-sugar epimerase
MRVLITGGSGFIGTNLVERFIARGDVVLNLDISAPRNPVHLHLWKFGDLLDFEAFSHHVRSFMPEVVFHMAARTDLDGKTLADYSVNTDGVENLTCILELVPSVRRVIFASSRLVCKIGYSPINEIDYCPTTPYGESKVLGELIVRDFIARSSVSSTIVRPTSIWGPWFSIPYKNFFISVANSSYFHPGNLNVLKSFGYIGNTVHQLECLLNSEHAAVNGKTIYLADYPPIDVRDMANAIRAKLDLPPVRNANIYILRLLAKIGDGLKFMGISNPPLTSFRLTNLITQMTYDLNPLTSIAGELPYTMEEGVDLTLSWLKAQGELF